MTPPERPADIRAAAYSALQAESDRAVWEEAAKWHEAHATDADARGALMVTEDGKHDCASDAQFYRSCAAALRARGEGEK